MALTERRDAQILFGALSAGSQLTTSSAATGYSFGGWSITNVTPLRTIRGDDTLANVTRVVATLINDLMIKSNPTP